MLYRTSAKSAQPSRQPQRHNAPSNESPSQASSLGCISRTNGEVDLRVSVLKLDLLKFSRMAFKTQSAGLLERDNTTCESHSDKV